MRQGRRNLDGYRMYYNPEMVDDLFDAASVFDPARPTHVPPMGGESSADSSEDEAGEDGAGEVQAEN